MDILVDTLGGECWKQLVPTGTRQVEDFDILAFAPTELSQRAGKGLEGGARAVGVVCEVSDPVNLRLLAESRQRQAEGTGPKRSDQTTS
jgi:hypothetical protein